MSGQSRSGTKDPISTRDFAHFALSADQDPSIPARRNASRRVERRPSLQSSGQVATPASSSGFATPRSSSHAQQRVPPATARVAAPPPACAAAEQPPRAAATSEFWDWENAIDFTDVAEFYEPQGELASGQYQPPGQDFSFPHAISVSDPSVSANSPQLTSSGGSPFLDAQAASNPYPALPFAFLPPPARGSTSASAQPAMKRKDRSESASIGSSAALPFGHDSMQEPAAKRTATSRSSSVADESPTVTQGASFVNPPVASPDALGNAARGASVASAAQQAGQPTPAGPANASSGTHPMATRPRKIAEIGSKYSAILPAGKVFPIQIGNELFRLSGASISSDGESSFNVPLAMNKY
ncbi:Btb poz domain-containing protein [Neofusicoccum parvum]|nr:Btb poz domain-containing protein [Neofusicoccum parvum]